MTCLRFVLIVASLGPQSYGGTDEHFLVIQYWVSKCILLHWPFISHLFLLYKLEREYQLIVGILLSFFSLNCSHILFLLNGKKKDNISKLQKQNRNFKAYKVLLFTVREGASNQAIDLLLMCNKFKM